MAMVRIRELALAGYLAFVSGEAIADPQLTHIRDNRYQTSVGDLIDNPSWFDSAYVFVFNEVKRGNLSPDIRYDVIVRQGLDPEHFVSEKVSFKLYSERPDQRIEAFNQRIRMSKQGALAYLEANRDFLGTISPDAVSILKRRLAEYDGMERAPNTPVRFVPLERFDPNEPTQKSIQVARYIQRQIMVKSESSHFLQPDEIEDATRFLDQEASRMGFPSIEDMTKGQAIKFVVAAFNPGVLGYRQDATYDPISFRQFLAEGGNCTDYGWNSARAWNLMKGRNPEIEGMFWLPTHVYPSDSVAGHMIDTLINTRTGQATFVDLTTGSNGSDTRTMVIKGQDLPKR